VIEVLAWLWLPALLYGLSFGSGLLVERIAGASLSNTLVAPVGLAMLLMLITPGYHLGAGFEIAAGVALVAALAGALVAGRSIRSRLWPGWMPVAGSSPASLRSRRSRGTAATTTTNPRTLSATKISSSWVTSSRTPATIKVKPSRTMRRRAELTFVPSRSPG